MLIFHNNSIKTLDLISTSLLKSLFKFIIPNKPLVYLTDPSYQNDLIFPIIINLINFYQYNLLILLK